MLRVYDSLFVEHDVRLIGLSIAICFLASITSLTIVQRGIAAAHGRKGWLALGGLVTGVGIWTTHFCAMLAYSPGVEVRFDIIRAALSIIVAVALSTLGWVAAFGGRRYYGLTGGLIVGLALAAAHFFDMTALRVAGRLSYDIGYLLASLLGGVTLCGLAGYSLQRQATAPIPGRSAALLGLAIIFLHFVAMFAVTIVPTTTPATGGFELGLDGIAAAVVASSLLLLIIAFAVAYHERRLANLMATDRERLAQLLSALSISEERQRIVLRATSDVIWDWSHRSDWVEWNEAIENVLGYPEATAGTPLSWLMERIHPDDLERALAIYQSIRTEGHPYWNDEYRIRHADGRYVHMFARGHVVRDENGVAIRSVGALQDISAQKHIENDLRWAAHHDPLTKLPNRALFNQRLAEALARAERTGKGVGLVIIDLDDFKALNDAMGHAAGDTLLCEVADRLLSNVPSETTVARLGGDEFAIIVPGTTRGDRRPETVEKIMVAMAAPLYIDGRLTKIDLSAGAAVWPQDGQTAGELLKSADLALYAAKAEGPNVIRAFKASMRDAAERQRRMLADARHALEHHRIVPFYQPKVCLGTGRLIGFEALLRWIDPANGPQLPGRITAAFEDSDLSVQLTDRMLDRILADIGDWRDAGLDFGRIAFNSATVDFLRGDFAQRVLGRLEATGVGSTDLELEVTETVLLGQLTSNVERALRQLSGRGIRIALDDFGTGYASLIHLKQFPVDALKIDRTFVSRFTTVGEDAAIVGALIDLAAKLGIATIAEGVESAAQARRLRAYGCDAAQGFLFGAAVPASDMPALIRTWDAKRVLAVVIERDSA